MITCMLIAAVLAFYISQKLPYKDPEMIGALNPANKAV